MNFSRNPLIIIRSGTPSNDWLHQILLATPGVNIKSSELTLCCVKLNLGFSGHAPRRLEAQNRRGSTCFNPATLFLLLHFLSRFFIFTLVCAASSQFSLAHVAIFILSCILSRFLAHVLTGTWCSLSRVGLSYFPLLCLLWFHSLNFAILSFW